MELYQGKKYAVGEECFRDVSFVSRVWLIIYGHTLLSTLHRDDQYSTLCQNG